MKKLCIIYFIMFLSLLFCFHAWGTEKENNILRPYLDLIDQGEFQAAEKGLKDLYKRLPVDDDRRAVIHFHLGRALLMSGKNEEAIHHFGKAAEYDPLLSGKAIFNAGMALNSMGKKLKAMVFFRHVAQNYPETAIAGSAEEMHSKLFTSFDMQFQDYAKKRRSINTIFPKHPTKEKPWSLSLSLGAEYDDNAGQLPKTTTIEPGGIESKDDFRITHGLSGSYLIHDDTRHRIYTNASYYGITHINDSPFDINSVSGSVLWRFRLDRFQAGLGGTFSQAWLSSERDSRIWKINPRISYHMRSWTWADLSYEYSSINFFGTPPTPEENRDSDYNYFSLKQWFSFDSPLLDNNTTLISLGLNHSTNNAEGLSYENDGTGGSIYLMQELTSKLSLECSFSYREIEYDHPNIRSALGLARSDDQMVFSARLYRRFTDYLTVFLGYRYFENNSNIPDFYEYNSTVYSLGIRVDI
jgi:hypothetical protein